LADFLLREKKLRFLAASSGAAAVLAAGLFVWSVGAAAAAEEGAQRG
jgi:hypothetical protein